MKEIYVLNENGQPELISAGVERYEELQNAPIKVKYNDVLLSGSYVELVKNEEDDSKSYINLTSGNLQPWTATEFDNFAKYAEPGRYSVESQTYGPEILLINYNKALETRQIRRSNVSGDQIWLSSGDWASITDTKAEDLIWRFLNRDSLKSAVVVGDPVVLEFYYYSGSYEIANVLAEIGGRKFMIGSVRRGENISIDMTQYIKNGENVINITFENGCSDPAKGIVPPVYITGVEAKFNPTFNQYFPFDDTVSFGYKCSGAATKIITCEVINANGKTIKYNNTHKDNNANGSISILKEDLADGVNTIRAYMEVYEGAELLTSTYPIEYKIPFFSADNDAPLLMVYQDNWDNLIEYTSLNIPYYIWKRRPNGGAINTVGNLPEIEFIMSSPAFDQKVSKYKESDPGEPGNHLQYNVQHYWSIGSLPSSFIEDVDKKATFSINGYDVDGETLLVSYKKSDVSINPGENNTQPIGDYDFSYNAAERSGTDLEWRGEGKLDTTMQLQGFNWTTDGTYMDPSTGDYSLLFSASSSAILKLKENGTNPLFSGAYPFTLEMIFQTEDIGDTDKTVMQWCNPDDADEDPMGIYVYPNHATFKSKACVSTINYSAGDKIQLAYRILNDNITDINLDHPRKPEASKNITYLCTYLNGILSKMDAIVLQDDSFPESCGTLQINNIATNMKLYAIRGYANKQLANKEILQNYISSFGDANTKQSLYNLNNLYDHDEMTGMSGEAEISFESLVDLDTMMATKGIPVYVVFCDELPRSKDYVKCLGIYYDNGENLVEPGNYVSKMKQDLTGIPKATTYYYYFNESKNYWERTKPIEVGGQGTSSLEYPRHNLKFKHNKNNQFYIKNHTKGADRTFTFKADYMDSSGANNISNAQLMDDAIIRERWKYFKKETVDGVTQEVEVPTPASEGMRVNLDGFPVAVFWCQTNKMNGGVIQNEEGENPYDVRDEKGNKLNDSITVLSSNPNLAIVKPKNPKYIGTFNFNYDKKAKKLLGWNEDNFQGFEFRGNSSSCNLFNGFENFIRFTDLGDGFEWRWTYNSDLVDDYHDGFLDATIDGGYVKEDEDDEGKTKIVSATEAEYLAGDADHIPPFNRYYVERDGKQIQVFCKNNSGEYVPFNYVAIQPGNTQWKWADPKIKGIYKKDMGICLEFGIKIGKLSEDDSTGVLYQIPFGIETFHYENDTPSRSYKDGSHYYDFEWNPEHVFYFKHNKTNTEFVDSKGELHNYYTEPQYWTKFDTLDNFKAIEKIYTEDADGTYVYDLGTEMYHLKSSYKEGTDFNDSEQFHPVAYKLEYKYYDLTEDDELITYDLMKDIMKNWCYVNEAVNHATEDNLDQILNANNVYEIKDAEGNVIASNGNGLFIWDSLTNYIVNSMTTGLCDNFAKNMFMHSYDGGITWSPAWYDMDTCFGLDNQGNYCKQYDLDFLDNDMLGARGFNGSDSKLWRFVYNKHFNELCEVYNKLRNEGKLGYQKIMQAVYDDNISYKPATLYNANAVFRYIEPQAWHNYTVTGAAQGDRLSFLEYWNSHRETFLDSLFGAEAWQKDCLTFRIQSEKPVTLKFTPDTNMYLGAYFNTSAVKSDKKILAGETWTHVQPGSGTNVNTKIYGASHLLDICDFSQCNTTELILSFTTKIRNLKLGDINNPPKVALTTLTWSDKPYLNLEEIDFTGVTFSGTLNNLSLLTPTGENMVPVLKRLKLQNSTIEYVTIPSHTPLTLLTLPESLKELQLKDLFALTGLYIPEVNKITKLIITNCPLVDQFEIAKMFYGKRLNTITLDNIRNTEDTSVSVDFLDWLLNNNATNMGGSLYVENIANENLDIYRQQFGSGLEIIWKQIFLDDAILGVEGESTATVTRTYGAKELTNTFAYKDTFAVLNDFDSTVIGQKLVIEDEVNHPGWVKINPFYTKYTTENGKITGRSISEFKIDNDYIMNPIFFDEQGNAGPVYIAKYLTSQTMDKLTTTPKATPIKLTPSSWNSKLLAMNNSDEVYTYSTETIWSRQLIQDLITIEFGATRHSQFFPGVINQQETGATDSLGYHTGINCSSGEFAQKGKTYFKYRGLENLWCGAVYIQGIRVLGEKKQLYVTTNDYLCNDKSSWKKLSYWPDKNGIGSLVAMRLDPVTDNNNNTYYFTSPADVAETGEVSYYGGSVNSNVNNTNTFTCSGGDTNDNIWSLDFTLGGGVNLYSRLVRRYKNNRVTNPTPEEE